MTRTDITMKREIKFRAWNRVNNEMVYLRPMDAGMSEGAHLCFMCEEYGHKYVESKFHNNDDWVLMQFTGLIDKNGKEIYEGDCVREYGNYKMFGEVVFQEGEFGYILRGPTNKDFDKGQFIGGLNNTHVIGNIFETLKFINYAT